MLNSFTRGVGIGASIGHVLECYSAFHILSCKYSLVLPFHEDLDVGWHGGCVSMWAAVRGELRPGGELPAR